MRVYEIKVKDLSYDSMRFKGRLQNGILSFDELKLTESAPEANDKADVEETPGSVNAGGWVNLHTHELNISASAQHANPAIITA